MKNTIGVSVATPVLIPYDPAAYCQCGHSKNQHRTTKGRTLLDGRIIEPREHCHVSFCFCRGFTSRKK